MVILNLSQSLPLKSRKLRRKGRPKVARETFDKGTAELQQKRQLFFQALTNNRSLNLSDAPSAVFDGCYLHQLFYQSLIEPHHLEIGLKLRAFHALCLRSQGIKNRLRGSLRNPNDQKGTLKDDFERQGIEKIWIAIRNKVDRYTNSVAFSQAILEIVLNDFFQTNPYRVPSFKDSLIKALKEVLEEMEELLPSFL